MLIHDRVEVHLREGSPQSLHLGTFAKLAKGAALPLLLGILVCLFVAMIWRQLDLSAQLAVG